MSHSNVSPAKAEVSLLFEWIKKSGIPACAGLTMMIVDAPAHAQDKRPPYWASIASGQAMTRTGPARSYPGVWLYQRRDLPVRVLKKYESWRLIEDPDGVKGWMLVTMLSDRRTAMIKPGGGLRPIRSEPKLAARTRYLAEAGVVGRIEQCAAQWCRIEIGGKRGYIARGDLHGLSPGEEID